MRFLLNVIWLLFSGFWMFLAYCFAGILWCITVVGIPFGVASFRIGAYALWPFGRELIRKPGAGVASAIGNVFWVIFSGLWLAIGHAFSGILCCITIIGIPFGLANFKMIPVAFAPLGREIVSSSSVADAVAFARAARAQQQG